MSREPDAESGRERGDGSAPDEFEAIVAALRREGGVPRWPDDGWLDSHAAEDGWPEGRWADGPGPGDRDDAATAPGVTDDRLRRPEPPGPGPGPAADPAAPEPAAPEPAAPDPAAGVDPPGGPAPGVPHRPSTDDTWAVEHLDEHFVPPEPPPLPRPGPPALVGLGLIGLGLLLLVAPGWIGVPTPYGLPLGLVALASGLGWLVLRLWPDSPSADGTDDDGAVL